MTTVEKLQQIIEAEWDRFWPDEWCECEDRGENPCDKWNDFLKTFGLIKVCSYEAHWGEHGVPSLIDDLVEHINEGPPGYVIEFNDGSNMSQVLIFDRTRADEAISQFTS